MRTPVTVPQGAVQPDPASIPTPAGIAALPTIPRLYHLVGQQMHGSTIIGVRMLTGDRYEFIVRNELGERESHIITRGDQS